MGIPGINNVSGNVVELARTNPAHMDENGKTGIQGGKTEKNFGNMVTEALGNVSDQQLNADALFEKMITNPDEVEPHDVTIAMAKAEMSLNMTKAVIDRAVKAYNEIIAMR